MPEPIEIFRAGTHTAMNGQAISFSEADLVKSAGAYDPKLHEAPVVVGHPSHDMPAYGWVSGLKAEGTSLFAEPSQVDPAFAEMVKAGRFKKISASFYLPNSASNPVPGVYYLKHVGFLGAKPPAVKGLKQAQFAESDEAETLTVSFGDYDEYLVSRLMRSLRDWVLGKFGQDEADKAVPGWLVDSLQEEAAKSPTFSETTTDKETPGMPDKDQAANQAELDKRAKELAAKEAAFAEREASHRKADIAAFADQLVKDGKLAVGDKSGLAAFMEGLDGAAAVSFGEGSEKQTSLAWFKSFMTKQPKLAEFGELAKTEGGAAGTASFAAPNGFAVDPEKDGLYAKALDYMATHPDTDIITAYKAVGGQ